MVKSKPKGPPAATKSPAVAGGKKKVKLVKKPNFKIPGGVWRYARPTLRRKIKRVIKVLKPKEEPKKPLTVTKKIGGEKNGGTREVKLKKDRRYYPTEALPRDKLMRKKKNKNIKPYLRSSITPGAILIILAGKHRGKRVIFLKQLETGLLLVTGPFTLNGCPLRRINQIYVAATSTKIDISKMSVSEHLNDAYFRRAKRPKKNRKDDAEIFETKKKEYVVSEQRKKDQTEVDKQILKILKGHPDRNTMIHYLKAVFSLRNRMYPHKLKL